jgi:hypothetical protein
MSNQPRKIYQIDGINGGILNIAECPTENKVILIIENGDAQAKISLCADDFRELADLRYSLRFNESQADAPALRVVA